MHKYIITIGERRWALFRIWQKNSPWNFLPWSTVIHGRPEKLRAQWCWLCHTQTVSELPTEMDETHNLSIPTNQNLQEWAQAPSFSPSAELVLYVQSQGIGIFPVNMTQELMCAQHLYCQSWGWAFSYSLQETAHQLCLLPESGLSRELLKERGYLCTARGEALALPLPSLCGCWSLSLKKMEHVVHAGVPSSFQEW